VCTLAGAVGLSAQAVQVGGVIAANTTWGVTGSPYVVATNVTVATNAVLTIAPGVTIQFNPNTRILVCGSLHAAGTPALPIVFTNHPPNVTGGAVQFLGSGFSLSVTGLLEHCTFAAMSSSTYGVALSASNAVMNVAGCTFESIPRAAMDFSDCRVSVCHNEISDTGINYDSVDFNRCAGLFASNRLDYTNGGWNALDINGAWAGPGDPTIVIEGNFIASGPGWDADCIDIGTSEAVVRGNVLTHAADKGLSIGEGGHVQVYDNLIYDCVMGIAVKDESIVTIANNTIVDCATGIACYRKYVSYPSGGHAFVTNTVIWNCATSMTVDAVSTLAVAYSCIQGSNVWRGAGNGNADPQFVNAAQHDWRLLPASPGVNTGTNLPWLSAAEDLDGNPRIVGGAVDMGAYEFVGVVDHFAWEPIASPRRAGIPFGAVVTARDGLDNVVTGFAGRARLSGWRQAGQQALALTPIISGNFVNGSWTGQVTVLQPATGVCLRAALTPGPTAGDSALFDVAETPALTVGIPSAATEGDGAQTGRVCISEAGVTDVVVTLTSSDATEATVPRTVTIHVGQTNAVFDLSVVNDDELDGTQTAEITATAEGWVSGRATIAVRDNERTTLALVVPAGAREGEDVLVNAGQVLVSAPVAANVAVALASSDVTEAVVPAVVTVAAGQTSAVFSIWIVDDTELDGPQTVTFTAHVDNWTDGTNFLTVLDNELHHFAASAIASPQTAGVPFVVAVTAYAADDAVIPTYRATLAVTAHGDSGPVSVNPPAAGDFVNGVSTSTLAVATRGTNIRLTFDDGSGHTVESNPFDVAGAVLAVSPTAIVNATVAGSVSNRVLTIENRGDAPLTYTIAIGAEQMLTNNLALYYTFDAFAGARVEDLSGNHRTGVVYGASWTNFGKIGSAFSFDGQNDYIYAGNFGWPAYKPYSFSLWAVMSPQFVEGWKVLMQFKNNRSNTIFCYPDGDLAYGRTHNTNVWERWDINVWTNKTDYHQIAVRCPSNGVIEMFFDGKSYGTKTESFTTEFPFDDVWVGGGPDRFFQGLIDEVRVYDRVLSSNEIYALYANLQHPTWLSANALAGSVPAGRSTNIVVSLDAAGLAVGMHRETALTLLCNDPLAPATVVPVSMDVVATPSYWLDFETRGSGSLNVTSGWFAAGTGVPAIATPGAYYHFGGWEGDTSGCAVAGNVITVAVDRARSMTAAFDANLVANNTPQWWLARYGLPTNDAGAMYEEGDAMPAWQEYVAGTDPTNPASFLGIAAFSNGLSPGAAGSVVRWSSVTGKCYRLDRATNLLAKPPFAFNIRSNIAATPPLNGETDTTATGQGPYFYRVGVE